MRRSNLLLICGACLLLACNTKQQTPQADLGSKVNQTSIPRVELMPDMPTPYEMIDWNARAKAFDSYLFDWNRTEKPGPLIWLDDHRRNVDQTTFGLYTAVDDIRQGPVANNGEFHESLNSLAALAGAGLVGIDKTNQDGYNYVKMIQNYFNTESEWYIVMNNTNPPVGKLGGGYGRDWWYDVFPNALFYAVSDIFPGVDGAEEIQRKVADQFARADSALNGNYNYSYFDYGKMEGGINHIPLQQDAAGGHAYVLLSAYRKFGDPLYLKHSKSAIEALLAQKESRFYEILLPLGVYTAAYLNATEGTDYDVLKLLNWTFDGCQAEDGRYGWGVIEGTWGPYDVSGLQGSLVDGGGYAFFMNSVKLTWPFIPMVKYEPQFATSIGKWMLNNANACRLFYPGYIADEYQWAPELKDLTHNNISYEGLRKTDVYNKKSLEGVEPVALGDGPNWIKGNPTESMFSVYSTAPVGFLGAIVKTTNIEGILQLDCNATDFYAERPYPVYLYYNPHDTDEQVAINTKGTVDLFDIVNKEYVGKGVAASGQFNLPAKEARVIVCLPAGTTLTRENGRIMAGNHTIAYK